MAIVIGAFMGFFVLVCVVLWFWKGKRYSRRVKVAMIRDLEQQRKEEVHLARTCDRIPLKEEIAAANGGVGSHRVGHTAHWETVDLRTPRA